MIPEEASRNDFAEEFREKSGEGPIPRRHGTFPRLCVEYFCPGGRESVLEQHILNLSRLCRKFSWPAEWLEERKK